MFCKNWMVKKIPLVRNYFCIFFPVTVSKHSLPAENTSSRLLEGSSSSQNTKTDSKHDSNPRLPEGSSGSQDSKGLLSVDSHTWSGSGSTSQDSKDHPFARSKLGTVKKASSGPPKPGTRIASLHQMNGASSLSPV